jgi:hypothetical protein
MCRSVADPKGPATFFTTAAVLISKAASKLLMKTKRCEMRRRLDEASSKNIANTTRQYEVIVPFAFPQDRIRKAFGQHRPAEINIEQRQEWVQRGVIIDIVGLKFST